MDWEKIITEQIVPMAVQYVPRALGLIVALVAAKLLSGWAGGLVTRSLDRGKVDEAVGKFLGSITSYGVLAVGVVSALGYVGIETASFAAVLAASGLAIGLAFQGTLSNFAAGVMLLIFRPFKVGDYIKAGGEQGHVVAIEMFTTELRTLDNQRVIIPNSGIFGGNITNVTHHDTRRVDIDVGTDYGADLPNVRCVLEEAAPKIPGVIADPAPQIFLAGLGASSIDWQVRVWCKTEDYWDVHQATILGIKQALDAAKVGIPFPQRDVHLDANLVDAIKRGQ